MTLTSRTLPAPQVNPENARFWEAARRGELLVGHCGDCGEFHYYPRMICPHCAGDSVAWRPAAGTGTIYSFSPLRRAPEPYTMAYVMLTEGVAMMTNLVDCDPDQLQIGQAVKVLFRAAEDGQPVPVFTPA